MYRGTGEEVLADTQQAVTDISSLDSVVMSVEPVGQLFVPREGNGPTLYLPGLENLSKFQEGLRPQLEAMAEIGRQVAKSGLTALRKRVSQWRRGLTALRRRRTGSHSPAPTRLEKQLLGAIYLQIIRLRQLAKVPQMAGTFIQQVFTSSSLMPSGPPSIPTGLPTFNLVTMWERSA